MLIFSILLFVWGIIAICVIISIRKAPVVGDLSEIWIFKQYWDPDLAIWVDFDQPTGISLENGRFRGYGYFSHVYGIVNTCTKNSYNLIPRNGQGISVTKSEDRWRMNDRYYKVEQVI